MALRIKKVVVWYNPAPMETLKGPRWDCEITYDNGERKRLMKVEPDKLIKTVDEWIASKQEK